MTQHPDTDHKPYAGDRYDRLRACAEDYASGTNFGDNFIDGDMVKALAVNLTTARVLDGLTDHDANTVAMLTILDFPRGIVHMIWRLKDWTSENRSVDIRDDDEFAVVSVLARVLAIVCAAFVDEEFEIGHEIFTELAAGQTLSVEKIVSVVTGRDVATSEVVAGAERRLGRQGRFAEVRAGHTIAWAHLWERLSIEFDNHVDELRILRLHLLHLLQTVSYNTEDLDVGVPARGLHGEAYRGHIFWDELFIFPVLNLRLPTVTRALLRYRYRRLIEARRAAKLAGYAGAMFPW